MRTTGPMSVKLAAIQLHDVQGDDAVAIERIRDAMTEADRARVDILCFPECFLQGYTLDEAETRSRAMNLASPRFHRVLRVLADHEVTVILGVIEQDAGRWFNTAVVIHRGRLLGRYRKAHLFEANFRPEPNLRCSRQAICSSASTSVTTLGSAMALESSPGKVRA